MAQALDQVNSYSFRMESVHVSRKEHGRTVRQVTVGNWRTQPIGLHATFDIVETLGTKTASPSSPKTLVKLEETHQARKGIVIDHLKKEYWWIDEEIDADSIGNIQVLIYMVRQRRGRVLRDLGEKKIDGRVARGLVIILDDAELASELGPVSVADDELQAQSWAWRNTEIKTWIDPKTNLPVEFRCVRETPLWTENRPANYTIVSHLVNMEGRLRLGTYLSGAQRKIPNRIQPSIQGVKELPAMTCKWNRRDMLKCGLGAAGLLLRDKTPALARDPVPAEDVVIQRIGDKPNTAPTSPVAIQRCETYEPKRLREQLDAALRAIGGIKKLVENKTLVGSNAVCTDAICTAAMGYDPQAAHFQFPFPCDNHLLLLAQAGVGTIDRKRIEVLGLPLEKAVVPFNPKKIPLDIPTARYSLRHTPWEYV